MYNVICTRPNASHLISGVPFVDHEPGGVITDPPVDEETASIFAGIPGYEIVDLDARTPVVPVAGDTGGRGRPSNEQVAAWTKEIELLGGTVPEGVKGKAVLTIAEGLKAAAATKEQEPAPVIDASIELGVEVQPVVEALAAVVDAIPAVQDVKPDDEAEKAA